MAMFETVPAETQRLQAIWRRVFCWAYRCQSMRSRMSTWYGEVLPGSHVVLWCAILTFDYLPKFDNKPTRKSEERRSYEEGVALASSSATATPSKHSQVKGSVDRSLLPSAIFLIFTRNRPWMSEDHLSTLFFIEMLKERLEKSERTPPVSWRPWALAYSRDRPYNLSCLSAMSKNGRLLSFSSALGCHLARKSLWWPAMLVSNKKQEFEQRKRIKLLDDFWVRAYRFDFSPRRRPRARSM